MNKEIQSISYHLQDVNEGKPWFGRPVFGLLTDIDPTCVYVRPNNKSHAIIELLYHMNTWADFTLKRIAKDQEMDMAAFEKLDWRPLDPKVNTWESAVEEYKTIHKKIVDLLETKEDDFLEEIVDYRKYNFRFLLNGMIEHNIYHAGQLAYASKSLAK